MHNHPLDPKLLADAIRQNVAAALAEDIGAGDLSAHLITENEQAQARVITREDGVFCGTAWVEEVFQQFGTPADIRWFVADGDKVTVDQTLFELRGQARLLLSTERTILNFVQLLSGTATRTAQYVAQIDGTRTRLLDTRKTLPGLRLAQKYAVKCGGGENHRIGLFDAYLLKENHIAAAGSITQAITVAARLHPDKPVEVEVENLEELQEAIAAGAHIALIDNFSLADTKTAVALSRDKILLEASGGITLDTVGPIAATGVDYISCGELTKNIQPIDLSMRFFAE